MFGPNGPISGLRRMAQMQLEIENIDPLIARLVEADLIVVDGHRYEFRSDLVRDVAYATLTKTGRAITHHAIASYLENLGPAEHRLAIVLVIARHYAAASELLEGLSGSSEIDAIEVREKALYWVNEAANRSLATGAPTEAEHWYGLGVDLATDPETKAGFLYGRARSRSDVRDIAGARDDLDHIVAIAAPDPLLAARVQLEHGELDRKRGDYDRAVQQLAEAAVQLHDLGDSEKEALALRLLGLSEMGRSDTARARSAMEKSKAVAAASDDRRSEAWALHGLGLIAFRAGDLAEARELVSSSVSIFGELGDVGGMAWAKGIDAWVSFHSGEWDRARDLLAEVGPELARRGDPWAEAVMKNLAASLDLWSGNIGGALSNAEAARTLAERADDPGLVAQATGLIGRSLVALGEIDDGRQVLESGFLAAERTRNVEAVRFAVVANASTAALLGEAESAIRWAARFEEEAPDPEMLGETDLAVAVALAMLQRGAAEEASSHLRWVETVSGEASMNARAVEAIVAAARGDVGTVFERVDEVLSNRTATYLDQSFAHLAGATASRQQNDLDACREAIDAAKMAVAGTDDSVMPLIIAMAEASCGLGNIAHTEVRFRGLGLDPDGWRHAWSLAASGGLVLA